jgi:succinate dehydrogenase / fumarate reductase, cytochrome b subunit
LMTRPRPLSPHLSVYRFTLTMTMSIVHRITGGALYVGTLLLVIWLAAAAIGEPALGLVQGFFGFWLGQLILFGFTWALFHHMVGGLRHLVWDTGSWLYHPQREWLAWTNLIAPIVLTLAAWGLFVWFR